MRADVVELYCSQDVLTLARFGVLSGLPYRLRDPNNALHHFSRAMSVPENLYKLRSGISHLVSLPVMWRLSDVELERLIRSEITNGHIDAVVVSLARVRTRPTPLAARLSGERQQRGQLARSVPDWPLERRLEYVIRRTKNKVPAEASRLLDSLLSAESIAMMVGLITFGALANLTPYGWAADAIIVGIAFVFGGLAAVQALGDLVECFDAIVNAGSEQDLERAADALARAIVAIGAVALIALLHRFAKGGEPEGRLPPKPKKPTRKVVEEPKQKAPKPKAEKPQKAEPTKPSPKALDEKFGAAQPPGGARGIKPFEQVPGEPGKAIKNPTLQKPTPENPPKLDPAKAKDPGYIWAIDEEGNLLIAEEVPVGAPVDGYQPKLGHPTLTEGKPARIAGELKYEDGKWSINNNSGRYSEHLDRTPDKLGAAADKFGDLGVDVGENFNPNRLPK